jgi:gamma-glutamyltranspeptidase/glutathione hydrolase
VKAAAVASESAAETAATEILEQEGTAAEALIAGFLAASAARPGALCSPIHAIMAGPSTFARAFEGRARQPGLGLPRPRGAVSAESVPAAATVAAPGSLAALAVLHAYDGSLSFQRLAGPARELAKGAGAMERHALLTKVGRLGPGAFRAPPVLRPLLAVAGRTEGGLLTEQDFAELRPESAPPRDVQLGDERGAWVVPWPSAQEGGRRVEVIAAADIRGVIGVLCYAPDDDGVKVPELGIRLARDAVVVRRGVTRVSPGQMLPAPAPIAIAHAAKLAFMALGVRAPKPLSPDDLAKIWPDSMEPGNRSLATARDLAGGAHSVGLVRAPRGEQVQKLSLPSAV